MILQLILLVVLLACSAFFSGSETAFFALSRYELNQFSRDRRASHRMVAELLRHPRKLLLGLMIGNVTVNLFIYATSLSLLRRLPGSAADYAPVLGLVVPVFVTLVVEILPKGIAIVIRNQVAVRAAPLVRLFRLLIAPVELVLNGLLIEPLTRLLAAAKPVRGNVTVEEISELLELSRQRRIIDADENAMLEGAIRLGELRVRDVMIPRVDIIAFDINDDPAKLRGLMRDRRVTKLPVYEGDIDRLIGLVYSKDLFLNPDRPLKQLVRRVRFVPELISLAQLLNHFRRTRTQLAIVVDEYGGVVGLVTVEDVAEELVGDLILPGEEDWSMFGERLDERRYRIAGRVRLRDWAEQFNVALSEPRATTLAGLVIDCLGRLPAVGDQVRIQNLLLTVESLRGRRIEWIGLEILPEETGGETDGAAEKET